MSEVLLTERQLKLLDELTGVAGNAGSRGGQIGGKSLPDQSIVEDVQAANYEAFYRHLPQVKARHRQGQESVTRKRWEWIERMQSLCGTTCDELDALLSHLSTLDGQRQDVVRKTTDLHDQCDQMVQDQERLSSQAEAIAERLDLFDRVADVARILDQGTGATSHPDFGAVLDQLDGSIAFLETHHYYCQAQAYLHQFEHLRNRACISMRSALQKSLEKSTSQVEQQLREQTSGGASSSVDTQVFYTRFKAAALNHKPLMSLLNDRAEVHEMYAVTLEELEAFYVQQRVKLISAPVTSHLQSILHKELPSHELAAVTRQASSYILDISHFERSCFEAYFEVRQPQEALRNLQEAVADIFYKALRPVVLASSSIDSLREMADCLQMDVLEPNQQSSRTDVPVLQVVFRLHKDVQEKLIFCTSTYIRDEIKGYKMCDADLEYPGILFAVQSENAEEAEGGADFQRGWFPTLKRTLGILAKIYQVVELTTFQGLAQEAVDTCIISLKSASHVLANRSIRLERGSEVLGPLVQMMDGQLFLIKHLLILREQVAAFECDLVSNEKYFNFSNVWDALHLRLPEGLLGILKPKLMSSQVDTKKDIEAELKAACETLITFITAHITQPLGTLNTQIGDFLSSRGGDRSLLKEQAFMSPERLKETINLFLSNVKERVPFAAAHIRLYLASSSGGSPTSGSTQSTAQIMFMPVQKRLGDTWDRLESLMHEWQMTKEQMRELGFIEPEELRDCVLKSFYDLMEAPWSEVIAVVDQVSRSSSGSPSNRKNSGSIPEAPSLSPAPPLASNSSPTVVEAPPPSSIPVAESPSDQALDPTDQEDSNITSF